MFELAAAAASDAGAAACFPPHLTCVQGAFRCELVPLVPAVPPFPCLAATRNLWVEGNATIYTNASVGGDFFAFGRSNFGKRVLLNTTLEAKQACKCSAHTTFAG